MEAFVKTESVQSVAVLAKFLCHLRQKISIGRSKDVWTIREALRCEATLALLGESLDLLIRSHILIYTAVLRIFALIIRAFDVDYLGSRYTLLLIFI